MMLLTRNATHQESLGLVPNRTRALNRRKRSMLLLAGVRLTPGVAGAFAPALAAASNSFAGWNRHCHRALLQAWIVPEQQQQQWQPHYHHHRSLHSYLCKSCGDSNCSSSRDAGHDHNLFHLGTLCYRLQHNQHRSMAATGGKPHPYTAAVVAAATAAGFCGSCSRSIAVAAATVAAPNRRRSRHVVQDPDGTQQQPVAAVNDTSSSSRDSSRHEQPPAAPRSRRRSRAAARQETTAATLPTADQHQEQGTALLQTQPNEPAAAQKRTSRRSKPAAAAAAPQPPPPPSTAARKRRTAPAAAAAAADGSSGAGQQLVAELQQQASELLLLLNRWSYAYYNGEAEADDEVYDSQLSVFQGLLDQLRAAGAAAVAQELEDNSPIKQVGAPVSAVSQLHKVTHPVMMTSLAAMRSKDELMAWASRLRKSGAVDPDAVEWVLEPKVDGLAVRVVYRDGRLSLAAVRGDGKTGEEITHNIITGSCKGLPATLKPRRGVTLPSEFEVRGEVYMRTSDFSALNAEEVAAGRPGFANARNVASGSARLLDPEEFIRRRLSFMAYQLLLPLDVVDAPTTQSGCLDWLKAVGIDTTMSSISSGKKSRTTPTYDSFTAAVTAGENWMETRESLDYEVDGAVLKINDLQIQQQLGVDGARDPKWAVAWKFPAREVVTELEGIEWSVGRTGVVTPVALLKPVECGGVTVKRAALHNLGMLRSLDLRIGDYVRLKRAGDVIPQIVGHLPERRPRNSSPIERPRKCPSCTQQLTEREAVSRDAGETLLCENQSCPAQQLSRLQQFAAVCMDGVGDNTVAELWSMGLLHTPAGFYKLKMEDLLRLRATKNKKATKIMTAINDSKNMTLAQLIQALGIPSVGHQQAERLADKYETLKALQLWSSRNNGHGHDGSAASHHHTAASSSSTTTTTTATGEKGVLGESLELWFTDAHNKLLLNELRDLGVRACQEDDQAAEKAELSLEQPPQDPRVHPRIGGLTPGNLDVKPLEGISVCVTGKLTSARYGSTRQAAKDFITERGGVFHENFKASTQWLVKGLKPGSAKIKMAEERGARILDEQEFNSEIETRVLQLQGYIDFPVD